MKSRSNIFFGGLLIAIGLLFLAFNYDFLNFSFREVARFWPFLILLGGLAILLHPQKVFFNTITALCLAFSIPLAIYSSATTGVELVRENLDDDFRFDFDTQDGLEKSDMEYDGKVVEQNYYVDKRTSIDKATLELGGGAAEFVLLGSTDKLFEATTLLSSGAYKLEEGVSAGRHEIAFDMNSRKNKGNRFSTDDNFQNKVEISLNKQTLWDIELGIGAGDLKFDLSDFMVGNLEVETGAASVDIKMSDLMDNAEVEVSSGVAKVVLRIPRTVGCRVKMDGALNTKDFEDFEKVSSGKWQTSNYKSSPKTIEVKMNSGLSSLSIERY